MNAQETCAAVGAAIVAGRPPPHVSGAVATALRHFLRVHGLSGLAYSRIQEDGPFVPKAAAAGIRQDWATAQAWSSQVDRESERLGQAAMNETLADTLSSPILLKGAAVARRYRDPPVRTYLDLDLLVPPEEVRQWATVLMDRGYWAPPSEIFATARRYQEGVSFLQNAADGALSCDLHSCLFVERRARSLTYTALVPYTEPSPFPGLLQLQPAAQLVALALHFVHHYINVRRLVWIRDFLELGQDRVIRDARSLSSDKDVRWALEAALLAAEQVLGRSTWKAGLPQRDRHSYRGLASMHEMEGPNYLHHLALVRELGPADGFSYLLSRVAPQRFARPGDRVDWMAARGWASKAMRRMLRTPWSRGFGGRG